MLAVLYEVAPVTWSLTVNAPFSMARAGVSLEPEVLALGAVEVLLPQPGGGRVRGVLVDGLRVVLGELAVRGDGDLPVDALGLELVGVSGVEVVPVDADRCLALLDG